MCIWIFRLIVINEICQILQYPTDFGNYNKLNFYSTYKKYLLEKHFENIENICQGKNQLKPMGFGLLWKLSKIHTFMPFISLSKVSEQSRQAGWLDILHKRALTGDALNVSQAEVRKVCWMPGAESQEGDF